MSQDRPMRSLLFVPANNQRMIEKARTLPADAVFLDLEDSIPLGEKDAARQRAGEVLAAGSVGRWSAVRVNGFQTGLTEADVRAVAVRGLSVICLPKAEAGADVARVASLLESLERERGIAAGTFSILPIVETGLGQLRAYEVASASPRVVAVLFGAEDYCADLGARRSKEGLEILYARSKVVADARAAGVPAVDTVFTDLNDMEGLAADATNARRLGFRGKLVIHPRQIEVVNRVFTPTDQEIAYARRVIEAFDEASERGAGAVSVDGKMIDVAVVVYARHVLALAEIAGAGTGQG